MKKLSILAICRILALTAIAILCVLFLNCYLARADELSDARARAAIAIALSQHRAAPCCDPLPPAVIQTPEPPLPPIITPAVTYYCDDGGHQVCTDDRCNVFEWRATSDRTQAGLFRDGRQIGSYRFDDASYRVYDATTKTWGEWTTSPIPAPLRPAMLRQSPTEAYSGGRPAN